jgi:5-methylcytosine-specific restriction endonuclease McrA
MVNENIRQERKMDVTKFTKKTSRKGTAYFEDSSGKIVAKTCTICNETIPLERFQNRSNQIGGKDTACKPCRYRTNKKYREQNKEKISEYYRGWYERNREQKMNYNLQWIEDNKDFIQEWREKYKERKVEIDRLWRKNNADKVRLYEQRRRARVSSLPDDITDAHIEDIMTRFNSRCAITGDKNDIQLDHVIPISRGHGGTTLSNIIPLRRDLNYSKNDSNLFVWFDHNKERLNLDDAKFNELIEYLASVNDMTIDEYTAYYNSCFADKSESGAIN